MLQRLLPALLLFCALACGPVNQPLNSLELPLESRTANHTRASMALSPGQLPDNDGCFVGIAISGGGLRSANFSAAVLFQLQKLGLLQRVDYLSAVSGGSITATYYCVCDDAGWNPQAAQQRMTHSYATDLAVGIMLPWNAAALAFTPYNTSDILAESFDRQLYHRGGRSLTFADLRPDRPRLLVNATDLQSGNRFVFCNENFDQLNSDLGRFPVAHAVAASGAFPVALHEKTLRDYSTSFAQYRHFIDGGVTDNLGIQSLIDAYEVQNQPRPDGSSAYPRGAVLIIIDAGNRYDARLSDRASLTIWERLNRHLDLATTALLARANTATLSDLLLLHASGKFTAAELRDQKLELDDTGLLLTRDRHERPIRVIHISLTRLHRLRNLPFPSFGESVQTISTFYNISETEAYQLYQAADLLVNDDLTRQALQRVVSDLSPAAH